MRPLRIAFVVTHPIQYYSPWFVQLAGHCNLTVYYAHRQTPAGQAAAGFSTSFEWDLPLLEGYEHHFLRNVAKTPSIQEFGGCDTPEVGDLIRQGRFDAVVMIGWNKKCFLQAGLAAHRAGIPVFVRLDSQLGSQRSAWKRFVKRVVYRLILPWAAHYLSPGQRSDAYLRYFSVPEHRIHRVAHMVDTSRFSRGAAAARSSGEVSEIRKLHGASADDFVFLFVGKLIEKKRPHLLLEALDRLGGERRPHLWFVGDGPLEAEIDAHAARLALPVRRLGFVNQSSLPAVYAASDCLVVPSSAEETWGLVVNEAQAAALPAIVSEEAGCAPDLIVDGATGWTMRSPTVQSLAESMARAIDGVRDLDGSQIKRLVATCTYEVGTAQLLSAVDRVTRGRQPSRRQAHV